MFGKKKKQNKVDESNLEIKTIPADFYAGANPVIKFKKVEKIIDLSKRADLTKAEKKAFDKQTVSGKNFKWHPSNLFTSRKFLIIFAICLFVLFIIVASIYYWQQSINVNKTLNLTTPKLLDNVTSSIVVVPTSTPVETTTVVTSTQTTDDLGVAGLTFPSLLLGYGIDLDNDQLSDKEEEIFGSEPAASDTDKDGYSDGHEVFYLYNPSGIEPKKLADSSKVIKYKNPNFGYQIYYPADWTRGNVDNKYADMLFTTLSGESIEIKVFDRNATQNFNNWFALNAKGEKLALLEDFTSVFNEVGKMRNDKLVYYFTDDSYIYVILYRASSDNVVNYRQIITMVARSFRSVDNTFDKQWASSVNIKISTTTVASTSTIISTTTVTTSTSN